MTLQPGAYDPRFMKPTTLCRCGHILECCADCMGWLRENSVRISRGLRWWHEQTINLGAYVAGQRGADMAEADNLAYYESQR